MIRDRAGIQKGAGNSKTEKAGKITKAQLQEIAEAKMEHLNAVSIEGAMKTVAGTARSMGVEIVE
jgi:large subunit ribosomal protein L11